LLYSHLKAKVWLDLNYRKQQGAAIDSKSIRKHRNDVFRLYRIAEPGKTVSLPTNIAKDLQLFFSLIPNEEIDLKSLGLGSTTIESIIAELKRIYNSD
jgi:hypothetical protein